MSGDSRVPLITTRSELPAEHRPHFDAIAASRGSVRGPFAALLNRPRLAGRVAAVGAIVRFETALPARLREVAILTTAREWECAYIWAAHEPLARETGLRPSTIETVAAGTSTAGLPGTVGAVVRFGRELLGNHAVSDRTFGEVADVLDTGGVTELTATVGYYSLLGSVCNALEVTPDETASPS